MQFHLNVGGLAANVIHKSASRELVNETPDYEMPTFNNSFVESNLMNGQRLSEI